MTIFEVLTENIKIRVLTYRTGDDLVTYTVRSRGSLSKELPNLLSRSAGNVKHLDAPITLVMPRDCFRSLRCANVSIMPLDKIYRKSLLQSGSNGPGLQEELLRESQMRTRV